MMELLQQVEEDRMREREVLRLRTRRELAAALQQFSPGQTVYVFGSLTKPGKFHGASDIDIAFAAEPPMSIYRLQSMIEEAVHRPVDLLLMNETRLKDKILREGEQWTS